MSLLETETFRMCREKRKEKLAWMCREKILLASLKSKRISNGLSLQWYLWTFKVMNPLIPLILSACPNTIFFFLWAEKSFCLKDLIPYKQSSASLCPTVKSKWQICDIIIIFFHQEQTVKPLTQDGDFTAGPNRAAG